MKIYPEEIESLILGEIPESFLNNLKDCALTVNEFDMEDPITIASMNNFLLGNGLIDKPWPSYSPKSHALMHVLRYRAKLFRWGDMGKTQDVFEELEDLYLIVRDPDDYLNWLPSEKLYKTIKRSNIPVGKY